MADERKRELRKALTESFTTPLDGIANAAFVNAMMPRLVWRLTMSCLCYFAGSTETDSMTIGDCGTFECGPAVAVGALAMR